MRKGTSLIALLVVMALSACVSSLTGGGSFLSGIAAAGSPLVGTVTVKEMTAPFKTKSATIDANGHYSLDISNMTPPFLIQARGTANGHSLVLHSYVNNTVGVANVTDMTNMAVADALGDQPEAVFGQAVPSVPANFDTRLETAKDRIRVTISAVLTDLKSKGEIEFDPAEFDPLSTRFEANGQGVDKILDTVSFEAEKSGGTLQISIGNKADGKKFYRKDINKVGGACCDSGETDMAAYNPETLKNDVEKYLDAVTAIRSIYQSLLDNWKSGKPTAETLKTNFLSKMHPDFLNEGLDRYKFLEFLAGEFAPEDSPELSANIKIKGVCVIREGVTISSSKKSEKEYGTDVRGLWVCVTLEEDGITTANTDFFVYDGTNWLMAGDRTPYYVTEIESRMFRVFQMVLGAPTAEEITSGVYVNIEDQLGVAPTEEIKAIYLLNPAFTTPLSTQTDAAGMSLSWPTSFDIIADNGSKRTYTTGALLTESSSPFESKFEFTSAIPTSSFILYQEPAGLVIDTLKKNLDITCVAIDSTGRHHYTWVSQLKFVPHTQAELNAHPGYFPTIASIDGTPFNSDYRIFNVNRKEVLSSNISALWNIGDDFPGEKGAYVDWVETYCDFDLTDGVSSEQFTDTFYNLNNAASLSDWTGQVIDLSPREYASTFDEYTVINISLHKKTTDGESYTTRYMF